MKVQKLFFGLIALFAINSFGYSQTVKIGTQTWMTQNLSVDKFRNGDSIPQAKTSEEWIKAGENKQPAWCYYNDYTANGTKYGKLYNFYAVNDARGLAPTGYHIPTDKEWTILTTYLGDANTTGTKMKSTSGWLDSGNGTNSSGFSGLPGGNRSNYDGESYGVGNKGYWWSSTNSSQLDAMAYSLTGYDDKADRIFINKGIGYSVRCLKDL
jgi:uncharacterized protein (TIGR02145 family)